MGVLQTRIDAIGPAEITNDLSGIEVNTFLFAFGKALSERNISVGHYVKHSQEMRLEPSKGKVTAWETKHEYKAYDVVTHNSKRWVCTRDHGDEDDAAFDEEPEDTTLNTKMSCFLPHGTTKFDVITGLTVPGGLSIYKNGTAPTLDTNLLAHQITAAIDRTDRFQGKIDKSEQVSYTIDSATELTITVVTAAPLVEIQLQRNLAWTELTINEELSYLDEYYGWMQEYIDNLTSLANRTSNFFVVPDTTEPILLEAVTLDAVLSQSDGYLLSKFEWMVTQLQKLTWIDAPFSTWHKHTETQYLSTYYNSTKYIDGNHEGVDAGGWYGPDMFDTDIRVGFRTGQVADTGDTHTIAIGNYMRLVTNVPASALTYPGRHHGAWWVRNFDLSFTFSGSGRVQVGELECDTTTGWTRVWLPDIREEQNRYFYEVAEIMTTFRALFLDGVLTIYINSVEAVVMNTDFIKVPVGRYVTFSGDYPTPFEISTETALNGGSAVTISNYKFLAPDENLQQVKERFIYTEGEFEEDIDSESYTFTYSPGYTYTYTSPKDENLLNVPSLTLGTPTADTGDLRKSWKNQSFIFDDDVKEWDERKYYEDRNNITKFTAFAEVKFHGEPVEGSGPYSFDPPYIRTTPYYTYVSLIHFPIGYPKCPTPYTAVVYVKAVNGSNINNYTSFSRDSMVAETDASYDWGIPGILTKWVEVARVAVAANTKGSIDIADQFIFPANTDAVELDSDVDLGSGGVWYYGGNSRRHNTFAVFNIENSFEVKLIQEMNYDYV